MEHQDTKQTSMCPRLKELNDIPYCNVVIVMVENCNGGIKKTSKDLVVSGIIRKFAAKIYND